MNCDYKGLTLGDIITYAKSMKVKDINKIKIYSGDFECNYTHGLHMLQDYKGGICLGYEMHETIED